MKKHLLIWICGIGAGILLQTAKGNLTLLVVALLLEILLIYGAGLLIKSKNLSMGFLIIPFLLGIVGAVIIYIIPAKKVGIISTPQV